MCATVQSWLVAIRAMFPGHHLVASTHSPTLVEKLRAEKLIQKTEFLLSECDWICRLRVALINTLTSPARTSAGWMLRRETGKNHFNGFSPYFSATVETVD